MKLIQVQELQLILGATDNEHMAHKYPGRGAYLLQDGRLAIVFGAGGTVDCVNIIPTKDLVISEPAQAVEGIAAGGALVDPHRLVDQITEFAKVMKA
jgi:hypothetical protein